MLRQTGGLPELVRSMVHRLQQHHLSERPPSWGWNSLSEASLKTLLEPFHEASGPLGVRQGAEEQTLAMLTVMDGSIELQHLRAALEISDKTLARTLQDLKASLWLTWSRTAQGVATVELCPHRIPQAMRSALPPSVLTSAKRQLIASFRKDKQSPDIQHWLLRHDPEHTTIVEALQWIQNINQANRARDIVEGLEPLLATNEAIALQNRGYELLLVYVESLIKTRPTDPQLGGWIRKLDDHSGNTTTSNRLRLDLLKAGLQQTIGHVGNTRKHLDDAWKIHTSSPSPRIASRIATAQAWHAHQDGQAEVAAKWHGRSRRLARTVDCTATRIQSELGVATWQLSQGRMIETERTCTTLLQATKRLHNAELHGRALALWAHSLRYQGRCSEALRALWREMRTLESAQSPTGQIHSLLATGWCELELGRLGCAQEHLDDIEGSISHETHLILRVEAGLLQSRLLLASGNTKEALNATKAVQTRAERGSLSIYGAVAKALHSEALWVTGEHKNATRGFVESVNTLIPIGDLPCLAEVCRARARVMATDVTADELFAPIENWLQQEPALLGRLAKAIAFGQYHSQREHFQDGSDWIEAAAALHDMHDLLAPEEQSALRIHPWSRLSRAFG